ncbi:hypothetical protein BGW38_010962 [Lunasporangiospora selenospora]|uniref:G domain-containing protein n=1 Tax=Lunasporangiospora selenospora TaxID=979761 RepID=A0A9P6FXN6_9FUNG|nr:hypothetical protein BGW38_010962 [Lunasporangiospora selenospora]
MYGDCRKAGFSRYRIVQWFPINSNQGFVRNLSDEQEHCGSRLDGIENAEPYEQTLTSPSLSAINEQENAFRSYRQHIEDEETTLSDSFQERTRSQSSGQGSQNQGTTHAGFQGIGDEVNPASSNDVVETFNIVILGPTQSGKSTLIESIGNFFFPEKNIDFSFIGDGNTSCTKDIRIVEYESHLPEYELFNTDLLSNQSNEANEHGERIDVFQLLGTGSPNSFMQMIYRTSGLEVRRCTPVSPVKYRFRIIDTPGLGDTDGHDVRNVAKTLEALSKEESIHLILITLQFGTSLSKNITTALEDYRDIFSEMMDRITFVHTKCDFINLHPGCGNGLNTLNGRKVHLNGIMGREVPHFVIDSNLHETRKLCVYLRLEALYCALSSVKLNPPVSVNRIRLTKTKWMREIDAAVVRHQNDLIDRIWRGQYNIQTGSDAEAIDKSELEFVETESRLKKKVDDLSYFDTEYLELIAEARMDEVWGFFDIFRNARSSRKALEVTALPCTINVIRELSSGIVIKNVEGGLEHKYWRADIERLNYSTGNYHAKFYATRRNIHQEGVERLKREISTAHEALNKIRARSLSLKQATYRKLLKIYGALMRAEQQSLHLSLFKAAADAGVYEGGISCVERVAAFYTEYVEESG